jgi:hypothetical protein
MSDRFESDETSSVLSHSFDSVVRPLDLEGENQTWDKCYGQKPLVIQPVRFQPFGLSDETKESSIWSTFASFFGSFPNRDAFLARNKFPRASRDRTDQIDEPVAESKDTNRAIIATVDNVRRDKRYAQHDKWYACILRPNLAHLQGIAVHPLEAMNPPSFEEKQSIWKNDHGYSHELTVPLNPEMTVPLNPELTDPLDSELTDPLDSKRTISDSKVKQCNPETDSVEEREPRSILPPWLPCQVPRCRGKRYLKPRPKPGTDPYFMRCAKCSRPQDSKCAIPGCLYYTTRSIKTGNLHKYCHVHRPVK